MRSFQQWWRDYEARHPVAIAYEAALAAWEASRQQLHERRGSPACEHKFTKQGSVCRKCGAPG